jgi:hypothetical protein
MGNSKSKNSFKPRTWETKEGKKLSSVLYASMLESPAYMDLSDKATRVYTYMKLQFFGVKQDDKPSGNDNQFVFNKAMYTQTYKLCSNWEQFALVSHELVKNGFIEEVENGHTTRTKNVYRYSNKWQTWNHGDDFRTKDMIDIDNGIRERRKTNREKSKS